MTKTASDRCESHPACGLCENKVSALVETRQAGYERAGIISGFGKVKRMVGGGEEPGDEAETRGCKASALTMHISGSWPEF